jgi:hypothetical protein
MYLCTPQGKTSSLKKLIELEKKIKLKIFSKKLVREKTMITFAPANRNEGKK